MDSASRKFYIPTRFLVEFFNRFTTPMRHHFVHGVLAVAVFGINVKRFGLSWVALKDHLLDELFPLAAAISLAVGWHAFWAAKELISEIREENKAADIEGR